MSGHHYSIEVTEGKKIRKKRRERKEKREKKAGGGRGGGGGRERDEEKGLQVNHNCLYLQQFVTTKSNMKSVVVYLTDGGRELIS